MVRCTGQAGGGLYIYNLIFLTCAWEAVLCFFVTHEFGFRNFDIFNLVFIKHFGGSSWVVVQHFVGFNRVLTAFFDGFNTYNVLCLFGFFLT